MILHAGAFWFNAFVGNLDVFVRAGAGIAAGVIDSSFEDTASLAIAVGHHFGAKIDKGVGSGADIISAAVA